MADAIVDQETIQVRANPVVMEDVKALAKKGGDTPTPEPEPIPTEYIIPTKVDDSKIMHDVSQSSTIVSVVAGVLDRDVAYRIYFEVESEGTHFGADFVVFAYNGANCLTPFSMNISGQVKQCFAHLDNQGKLILDIPAVLDPSSQRTTIHYKKAI